jgi:hypothetical protein
MYLTNAERLEIARTAWERAEKVQRALATKKAKARRATEPPIIDVDYVNAVNEEILISVQYEAVAQLVSLRWEEFMKARDACAE